MAAVATFRQTVSSAPRRWSRGPHQTAVRVSRSDTPPLSPRRELVRAALVFVFIVSSTAVIHLLVVSSLQQSAAQGRSFQSFRAALAKGVAPIGPTDKAGQPLSPGSSVAFLEIPSIDVDEVVGEGTSSGTLFDGPGHRRDTPLPGQIGTSVIFGRRAAYGGPFSDVADLKPGDAIRVTTGQGLFEFTVTGVRYEGDTVPAAAKPGTARLVLVTAAGRAFLPEGVLRVDAELNGDAVVGPARLMTSASLPTEETVMAGDSRTLWALALWLQALIAMSVVAVWSWHRWGRAQAWVVFLPPMLLVGLLTAGEAVRLLPNLL